MFRFSTFPLTGSITARVATGLSGVALAASLGLLAGCPSQSSQNTSASAPPVAEAAAFHGTVYGGRQPIVGSSVTVYEASDSPGTPAVSIGSAITGADGHFTIPSFSPTPADNSVIYVVVSGGDATGTGYDNPAIKLTTVAGRYNCTNPANCVFHDTVNVNELTTVAMAYALGGITSIVGGAGGTVDVEAPGNDLNGLVGLNHSAQTFNNLVDAGTGKANVPGASACSASGGAINCQALRLLDTLANITASCVNATSGSTACSSLMSAASGTLVPSNTFGALHMIVLDPSVRNDANGDLWALAGAATIYTPELSAAPNAWALALNYTGGGLNAPRAIAVDSRGFIWVVNISGGLSRFNVLGQGSQVATGGGLSQPGGIAVDGSDNVWVANLGSAGLSEFDQDGNAYPGSPYTGGGLSYSRGVAVDSAGNVWVTNQTKQSISEFNSEGTPLSGSGGYTGGGLDVPKGVAIDASGNVWAANSWVHGGISEFDSSGTALSGDSGYTTPSVTYPTALAFDPGTFNPYNSPVIWVTSGQGIDRVAANGTFLGLITGGGLDAPQDLALDALGHLFARNSSAGISEVAVGNGTVLSPATGYTSGGLTAVSSASFGTGIAVGPAGYLWITNYNDGNSSVTEFIGLASPTRTPLAETLSSGFTP